MNLTAASADSFPLDAIVVGASAGGVEALSVLLSALPPDCPVPVALVLHIGPQRSNLLPQIFGMRCALPVKEAEDKEYLAPGTVYVAPPSYHLLVEPDRSFSLSKDEAVNFSRPSIDVLFESAAEAYGKALLGIILTGANHDGAAGLAAIRERGGLGWVQDPASALATAMPEAAIERAGADLILPLERLAEQLGLLVSGLARCAGSP
jgi:two-component system, chemotaxis family, protein-glutamate methylesterase/glutaminase